MSRNRGAPHEPLQPAQESDRLVFFNACACKAIFLSVRQGKDSPSKGNSIADLFSRDWPQLYRLFWKIVKIKSTWWLVIANYYLAILNIK